MTYGQLARRAARRLGRTAWPPRAVGAAVGRNPISIIIPCHRVVGVYGALTGYAGGVERKRWLLRWGGGGSFPPRGLVRKRSGDGFRFTFCDKSPGGADCILQKFVL